MSGARIPLSGHGRIVARRNTRQHWERRVIAGDESGQRRADCDRAGRCGKVTATTLQSTRLACIPTASRSWAASIRDIPWLSQDELAWIMGRGVCEWLGWNV